MQHIFYLIDSYIHLKYTYIIFNIDVKSKTKAIINIKNNIIIL